MAAFSAIKNKKNQKLREGIEDLALKCGDTNEESGVQLIDVQFLFQEIYASCLFIQVNLLLTSLEKMGIKVEDKELAKMDKMANKNKKILK